MTRCRIARTVALALAGATPLFGGAAFAAEAAAVAEAPLLQVKSDPVTGKIIATLPKPATDGVSARFIYLSQLETGLGSAAIGLDKAAPSGSRILAFRRIGKKVAAEVENPKFVASAGTSEEKDAVRRSFANSTVWMGDVVDTEADGSFTVDLAGFLVRDDIGVAQVM